MEKYLDSGMTSTHAHTPQAWGVCGTHSIRSIHTPTGTPVKATSKKSDMKNYVNINTCVLKYSVKL